MPLYVAIGLPPEPVQANALSVPPVEHFILYDVEEVLQGGVVGVAASQKEVGCQTLTIPGIRV